MSATPPRLLILGPGSRSGGVLNYIRHAVPGIVAQWGGDALIALPRTVAEQLPPELGLPGRFIGLDRPAWARGPLHVLPSMLRSRRIIREFDPDVVLTLGNLAYSGPRRPTLAVLNNAVRQRDLRWPDSGVVFYVAGLRILYWLSALRATRALAVSHHLKDILPRPLRGSRTVVVHHGVSLPGDRSTDASRPSARGIRVLLPGSIVPYRGIERVLDGMHDLDEQDFEIRIAGLDGHDGYRRRMDRLAERSGLSNRVRWLGHLSQQGLWDEMVEATHVIISSRVEACPNSLLEAASIDPSRPILGFRDAWSDEFAPLFDLRVEPHELAGALLATMSGSSATVIERRTRALRYLGWDECVSQTVRALRETMNVAAHWINRDPTRSRPEVTSAPPHDPERSGRPREFRPRNDRDPTP